MYFFEIICNHFLCEKPGFRNKMKDVKKRRKKIKSNIVNVCFDNLQRWYISLRLSAITSYARNLDSGIRWETSRSVNQRKYQKTKCREHLLWETSSIDVFAEIICDRFVFKKACFRNKMRDVKKRNQKKYQKTKCR